MIPVAVLNAVLVAVAALFVLVSLAVLVDRWRYERRTRRRADLRRQLTSLSAGADGDARIRTLVRQVKPADFQQVTQGLPGAVETSVARALRARHGADRLRARAEGVGNVDIWDRVTALHLLVAGGGHGSVHRALDCALRSGEPVLAGAAMRLLIRLNDRPAAELLVKALLDGACARARLAAALERLSVPYADLLRPACSHAEAPVRSWGARLAGRAGAREWLDDIRVLTTDADAVVRRAAVEALGHLGGAEDRDLLLARVRDAAPMVRAHAARAAARYADEAMACALAELLNDREWMVRAAARDALRRIGAPARRALEAALWHSDRFAANNAAEVLYLTGVMGDTGRRVLRAGTADARGVELLARFAEAGGPQLRRALLEQFPDAEAGRLLGYMSAARREVVA